MVGLPWKKVARYTGSWAPGLPQKAEELPAQELSPKQGPQTMGIRWSL